MRGASLPSSASCAADPAIFSVVALVLVPAQAAIKSRPDRANTKKKFCFIKLLLSKGFEHFVRMLFDIYLIKYLCDLSIFVDQKRLAIGAHVLLSVHAFLATDAVAFDDRLVGVGQQVERQLEFRDELL